jgi:hypothetical protein
MCDEGPSTSHRFLSPDCASRLVEVTISDLRSSTLLGWDDEETLEHPSRYLRQTCISAHYHKIKETQHTLPNLPGFHTLFLPLDIIPPHLENLAM